MIAMLLAAAVAASAPTDGEKNLVELRRLYSQSCEVRAYATFDRMCEGVRKQVREAERAQKRSARARPQASPAVAFTASATQATQQD
jgi:hypothetical protein